MATKIQSVSQNQTAQHLGGADRSQCCRIAAITSLTVLALASFAACGLGVAAALDVKGLPSILLSQKAYIPVIAGGIACGLTLIYLAFQLRRKREQIAPTTPKSDISHETDQVNIASNEARVVLQKITNQKPLGGTLSTRREGEDAVFEMIAVADALARILVDAANHPYIEDEIRRGLFAVSLAYDIKGRIEEALA